MSQVLRRVRDVAIKTKDGSLTNFGFGLLMTVITTLFFLPFALLF